ncbi:tyrosine-type recombinase/integrase [Oscillibacter sp.]|uniref:tyrosine-type recombinase/integrase n=1 Tax=Oscillibacter sp. TaxID=1945593 RepID=UPI0028ABFF77|nr:tyrosine-type recombinase/integrase [Oscillibacter sp.]
MNKVKPTSFALALSDFLFQYLPNQKGLSQNTVNSYSDALSLFLTFCESELHLKRERLDVKDISRDMVEKFLDWLEHERQCGVATRNQRYAALSSFFKYLQYKNPGYVLLLQQIRTIPRKVDKRQTVQNLSVQAIQEILKAPDMNTKDGRRDFAILTLMYESAARVSEIAALRISDLRFDRNGTVLHLLGKGSKPRIVPLIGDVAAFMKRYLADEAVRRPCSGNDPLFCNRSKSPLTRAGIAYILEKYVQAVRLTAPDLIPKHVYPHILRHSRAMHWLEAGIDLQYIKDLLGHADLMTTEVYAQLNTEMKREILKKAHPQEVANDAPSWTEDKSLMEWLHGFC